MGKSALELGKKNSIIWYLERTAGSDAATDAAVTLMLAKMKTLRLSVRPDLLQDATEATWR